MTGETPTTVRLHKENAAESGFTLNGAAGGSIDRALAVYYADVIETAVAALQAAMPNSKKLPRFTAPIPIVCAGGTTMAGNFLARLKSVIAETELPVADQRSISRQGSVERHRQGRAGRRHAQHVNELVGELIRLLSMAAASAVR